LGKVSGVGQSDNRYLNEVLLLIQAARECSSVDELQRRVLQFLVHIFKCYGGVFLIACISGDRLILDRVISLGIKEKFVLSFHKYFNQMSPFHGQVFAFPESVVTNEQFISFEDLAQTRYYRKFLRPQSILHQMMIFLKLPRRLLGGVYLFRSEDSTNFSEFERRRAQLMVPYLTGVLEKALVADQVTELETILNVIVKDLPYEGVIVLNEYFAPIYVTENASVVLNRISALQQKKKSGREAVPLLPENLILLCQRLRESAGGRDESQTAPKFELIACGSVQISVCVRLIRHREKSPLFLICFNENGPISSVSQQLKGIGVTSREVEVVFLVYQGMKNADIAKTLFISEHTVENHLKTIYKKMGVKNRTTLIYRLIDVGHKTSDLIPIQGFPSL